MPRCFAFSTLLLLARHGAVLFAYRLTAAKIGKLGRRRWFSFPSLALALSPAAPLFSALLYGRWWRAGGADGKMAGASGCAGSAGRWNGAVDARLPRQGVSGGRGMRCCAALRRQGSKQRNRSKRATFWATLWARGGGVVRYVAPVNVRLLPSLCYSPAWAPRCLPTIRTLRSARRAAHAGAASACYKQLGGAGDNFAIQRERAKAAHLHAVGSVSILLCGAQLISAILHHSLCLWLPFIRADGTSPVIRWRGNARAVGVGLADAERYGLGWAAATAAGCGAGGSMRGGANSRSRRLPLLLAAYAPATSLPRTALLPSSILEARVLSSSC